MCHNWCQRSTRCMRSERQRLFQLYSPPSLPINGQRVSFGQTDGRGGAILVRFTHFYSDKLRRTQTRWTDCLSESGLRPSKSQSLDSHEPSRARLWPCARLVTESSTKAMRSREPGDCFVNMSMSVRLRQTQRSLIGAQSANHQKKYIRSCGGSLTSLSPVNRMRSLS